ncbi:hypothetical protein BDE02_14G007100 [Populus trichocarpa]|nr:hypothetical protein BDE02_14G007100 [Populus trichocarpa]
MGDLRKEYNEGNLHSKEVKKINETLQGKVVRDGNQ